MGVPINDAEMFYNVLSQDSVDAVPIDTFIAGCLRMRGHAMSSDLQAVRAEGMRRSSQLKEISQQLNRLQLQVASLKEPRLSRLTTDEAACSQLETLANH